jgi:hypothetical protein
MLMKVDQAAATTFTAEGAPVGLDNPVRLAILAQESSTPPE